MFFKKKRPLEQDAARFAVTITMQSGLLQTAIKSREKARVEPEAPLKEKKQKPSKNKKESPEHQSAPPPVPPEFANHGFSSKKTEDMPPVLPEFANHGFSSKKTEDMPPPVPPEFADHGLPSKKKNAPPKIAGHGVSGKTHEPAAEILEKGSHILGVKGLRKRFGRREVVKGVDFNIKNGEVSGLLGPNGAGKTTIFYSVVGFLKPTFGGVYLDERNITGDPMYRRARFGITYLPQEASIFRKLSVAQNLWAILETRKRLSTQEKRDRLERLLEEFGITRIRNQLGHTLSGGERRRTEIARALATEPKFLLLDEPFAGIDPKTIFELKAIIRKLADKGIGVLITDHNVRDTLEITTKSFIINDGQIVAEGNKNAILENPIVREIYLGSEFRM